MPALLFDLGEPFGTGFLVADCRYRSRERVMGSNDDDDGDDGDDDLLLLVFVVAAGLCE